jgi:hypothetical protein
MSEYGKDHYRKNRAKAIQGSKTYKFVIYAIISSLKSRPCIDCGLCFPPCAMDFDHISGDKVVSIAWLRNMCSPSALVEELKKCELVCSNCHRIRTSMRLNSPKMTIEEAVAIISKRKKWYDREAWEELFNLAGIDLPPLLEKPKKRDRCVRKIGPEGKSWCSAHKDFIPNDRFERNASRWNGLQGQCVDCRKLQPSRASRKSLRLSKKRYDDSQAE